VGLTNLPPAYTDCLEILGASASLNACTEIASPLPLVVASNSLLNKFQNKKKCNTYNGGGLVISKYCHWKWKMSDDSENLRQYFETCILFGLQLQIS